jgi:hypothetical protein
MLKICYSSQCLRKEDEVDGSEPQKKKKQKGEECDLLDNTMEQEELQSVLGTQHKKRQRYFEDEGENGAERKKKKEEHEVRGYRSVSCQTQEKKEEEEHKVRGYRSVSCQTQEKKEEEEHKVRGYRSVSCQTQEEEDVYFTHLSSEHAFTTSLKSPVMDKVERDLCIRGEYSKAKKEKRKKRDLHNVKLSYMKNKNGKPTVKEESLVGPDISVHNQSVGTVTGNVEEAQVIAAPSVADLLKEAKRKLKIRLPKKHKKNDHDETESDKNYSNLVAVSHGGNKRKKSDKSHHKKIQYKSKKSKEKASFSFDPVPQVAEYMYNLQTTGRDDVAIECHSLKDDDVHSSTSNTSFRSSFCLTGAGMANAANRKHKKMNKSEFDAITVGMVLPLPPSSCSSFSSFSPPFFSFCSPFSSPICSYPFSSSSPSSSSPSSSSSFSLFHPESAFMLSHVNVTDTAVCQL